MRLEFVVSVRTVTESNANGYWRVRHKRAKAQRQAAQWAAMATGSEKPTLPMVVTLTRLAPKRMDCDNNVSAGKHVRDGVADWLGIDDGHPGIAWRYAQEASKEYGVRVVIEWGDDR